jgi:hypothetical protein
MLRLESIVKYALATLGVPDQEPQYYAGPIRKIAGRMAHKTTPLRDRATKFDTADEAEAMCKELGGGFKVVAMEGEE